MKDIFDNKLMPGDWIVYAVRESSHMQMKVAIIREIGIDYCKVTTVYSHYWLNILKTYNTTLRQSNTIVRINDIPNEYKETIRNTYDTKYNRF